MNIDKIISIVKTLREEAAMAAPTNNVGGVKLLVQEKQEMIHLSRKRKSISMVVGDQEECG